ncbi:hypothetical protein P153DRAFT_393472 [Dothidotthia symphoricarpi CBS 119687]|uniref:SnoaL-like domain-containing protein n=1 Tax=Dothidotthia symphoricarpi CBS 119687 TaxID=1392245 RepID=A0A6A6AKK8_9PLEO|nr:uncharacterized protein P153DRAFT_393472 [Dothidotthia symphoricarpi CBS 119687]KAF2132492.1 hypothetical protein P153DRAFT_393472 [Dothidotthia symphoricarpi CBS 119687]
MSFPTKQAFVHYGGWDDETRTHECVKWMEEYTNAIDAKAWDKEPYSNWLAADHKLIKSTGEAVSGGDASWSSLSKEIYAPLSEHLHEPQFLVIWEVKDGWEMIGVATLYWNIVAPSHGAGVKDRLGKEWNGAGPAAFKFHYVKQSDGGIKLAGTAIFADPTAAVVAMLKGGMMKPEDLLK